MSAYLDRQELEDMNFAFLGDNVLISKKASVYGASRISIGSHVRIDDFCILSAGQQGIELGDYIHIACYASLIGKELIRMGDFSCLSSRVAVYSSSDDYSGAFMTNPMVPEEFTGVHHKPVHIGRHCLIGAGSVLLPGITLGEGCAIGALSLVTKNCAPFGIYGGVPARLIKARERTLLERERMMMNRPG